MPLTFPTGRLLSPRWRLVAWSGLAFMLLALVGNGLQPDVVAVSGLGVVENPVAVPVVWTPWLDRLIGLGALLLIPSIGGAVAAVVVRFRRARGVERQQLKWCSFAAALLPLPFIVGDLPELGIDVPPVLVDVLYILVLPLLPLSVGIAIRRYRLYDIDRIINRTLVYGLLTALLAGLRRPGPGPRPAVRRARHRATDLGGGRRHPGRGGPVPAGPPPHPTGG